MDGAGAEVVTGTKGAHVGVILTRLHLQVEKADPLSEYLPVLFEVDGEVCKGSITPAWGGKERSN